MKRIKLTESQLHGIVRECIEKVISEADRHSPGYYERYNAKRKAEGKTTDRHCEGYYDEYNAKRGNKKSSNPKKKGCGVKKDRHRPGYYHDYNQAHPERLDRGFTKGYVNGNVSDGMKGKIINPEEKILGYDEMGRPITNDPLGDLLRNKLSQWHDDDWEESSWDD